MNKNQKQFYQTRKCKKPKKKNNVDLVSFRCKEVDNEISKARLQVPISTDWKWCRVVKILARVFSGSLQN